MYQAPILALGIGVVKLLQIGLKLLEKTQPVPLFLHYYTWLYLMLFGLYCNCLQTTYTEILSISDWLDPDKVEHHATSVMESDNEANKVDPTVYKFWKEEADLRHYPVLRRFSLLSPLWVLGTFVVCSYHTIKHVIKIHQRSGSSGKCSSLRDCPLHDHTISILALPLVYGLMSFKSVMRCWQICINDAGFSQEHRFNGFLDRKNFLEEMYEANFLVGDIYEAIALITFGKVISAVIKKNIARSDECTATKTLLGAIRKLTVAGVTIFATSCFLSAGYVLVVTFIGLEFPSVFPGIFGRHLSNPGLLYEPMFKEKLTQFLSGFGFAASWAAIGNILTVEKDFHDYLQGFNPKVKFWGTKVLVTLAFVQSTLLAITPPFSSWGKNYCNLFYSSVLCFQCCILSLLHMHAWNADEAWYHEEGEVSVQLV
mmetsp:Transcript_42816/g.71208  ORF Transcript_42816/g.71208 Transcript_42816/m.71208 type:complete len:427 (+) Transcript_42816:60-1340(+)